MSPPARVTCPQATDRWSNPRDLELLTKLSIDLLERILPKNLAIALLMMSRVGTTRIVGSQ